MATDAVRARAEQLIAKSSRARSSKVLSACLERGSITTAELVKLGYRHPPRARQDCVDRGFPMHTDRVPDTDGTLIARYSLKTEGEIRAEFKLTGRAIIPKAFKAKLVKEYGAQDGITGVEIEARALQVDHRIPYQVSGDEGLWAEDATKFMLLTASSQRKKAFSCQQCPNFTQGRDAAVCATCFWASPESYEHIGMKRTRHVQLVWQDHETEAFDRIEKRLTAEGRKIEDVAKELLLALDK